MKLLVPSVFLLLALGCPATAEVVQSFAVTCGKFFFKGTPPTVTSGNNVKEICQRRNNVYEYATLYDTARRIPIYSAYEFQYYGKCGRRNPWFIEPQLDNQNGGPDMATEWNVPARGRNQALNGDYNNPKLYQKGHLVPKLHRNSKDCSDATFTLTNAAPQVPNFNGGQWRVYEAYVAYALRINCLQRGFRGYIVTGVVPGFLLFNNRVNVPDYFWSAFYCVDNNDQHQFSGAYYGYNNANNIVSIITIPALEAMLTTHYGNPVKIFS